jgi:hypothetical protein
MEKGSFFHETFFGRQQRQDVKLSDVSGNISF